jgi:hypothetical protein
VELSGKKKKKKGEERRKIAMVPPPPFWLADKGIPFDSYPVLLYFSELRVIDAGIIESFHHQNCNKNSKVHEIKCYWMEATKKKTVVNISNYCNSLDTCSKFESSSHDYRYTLITSELNSIIKNNNAENRPIYHLIDQEIYVDFIKYMIPIYYLSTTTTVVDNDLQLLFKLLNLLLESSFRDEYISVLALNLPHLCRDIVNNLLLLIRQERSKGSSSATAAVDIRTGTTHDFLGPTNYIYNIITRIASKHQKIAESIRNLLLSNQEFPSLILDISQQYLADTLEVFIDENVLFNSSHNNNPDTHQGGSWLLAADNVKRIEYLSNHSITNIKNYLSSEESSHASAHNNSSKALECIRSFRIFIFLQSLLSPRNYVSYLQQHISSQYDLHDIIQSYLRSLQQCNGSYPQCIVTNLRIIISFIFMEIILYCRLLNGKGPDSNLDLVNKELDRHQILLIKTYEHIIAASTSDGGKSSSYIIYLEIALKYNNNSALRELLLDELGLRSSRCASLLSTTSASFIPNKIVLHLLNQVKLMYAGNVSENNYVWSLLRVTNNDYSQVHVPPVISRLEESPGDWTCTLTLLFIHDLFGKYCIPGETIHHMMNNVMGKLQYPPHTWCVKLIDAWLSRSIQPVSRSNLTLKSNSTAYESSKVGVTGLPLLASEIKVLTNTLCLTHFEMTNVVYCNICSACSGSDSDISFLNQNHTAQPNVANFSSFGACKCNFQSTNQVWRSCWSGVVATYYALKYHAMNMDSAPSVATLFLSDYRELPIIRCINYLTNTIGNFVVQQVAPVYMSLIRRFCPEILHVDGTVVAYRYHKQNLILSSQIQVTHEMLAKCDSKELNILVSDTIVAYASGNPTHVARKVNAGTNTDICIQEIENIRKKYIKTDRLSDFYALLYQLWLDIYVIHPLPQMVELNSFNKILECFIHRHNDNYSYPKYIPSYSLLIEEPMVLFRLPHAAIINPCILGIVNKVVVSALLASKVSIHENIQYKLKLLNRYTTGADTAPFSHHNLSVINVINTTNYYQLQLLIVIRLYVELWTEYINSTNVDAASSIYYNLKSSIYNVIERILSLNIISVDGAGLSSNNLFELLLHHQVTTVGLELLMSNVAIKVPLLSALLKIIHNSFATPVNNGVEAIAPPIDVAGFESILKHVHSILTLHTHDAICRSIVIALPSFLYRGTLSINKYIPRSSLQLIETYTGLIVDLCVKYYSYVIPEFVKIINEKTQKGKEEDKKCMQKLREIIKNGLESITTSDSGPAGSKSFISCIITSHTNLLFPQKQSKAETASTKRKRGDK